MINNNFTSLSAEDTLNLGKDFAKQLIAGDVVIFEGDLGAGKTHFIKGICKYFRVSEEVTSPTFTLVNMYSGEMNEDYLDIIHIDLYRIENPAELTNIGFDEYLYDTDTIKLIEWPQKAGKTLDNNYHYMIEIQIDDFDENKRVINVKSLK